MDNTKNKYSGAEGPWPTDMEECDPGEELRLILIGKTGSGKSSSGNTILGRQHFLSRCSADSVTKVCQLGTSDYPVEEEAGRRSRRKRVVVLDLPGFGDTHLTKEQIITEISRCVALTAPGPHAFFLVLPLGLYTDEENMAVTIVGEVFGEAAVSHHTVVLFTRGDVLAEPIEQYLASAPVRVNALIDRCGGRYHVLNNRAPSDVQQVQELLGKVEQVVEDNGGGCYTNAMYREVEAAIREEEDRLWREEEKRLREVQVRFFSSSDLVDLVDLAHVAPAGAVARVLKKARTRGEEKEEKEDRVRKEEQDMVKERGGRSGKEGGGPGKEGGGPVMREEEDRVRRERALYPSLMPLAV